MAPRKPPSKSKKDGKDGKDGPRRSSKISTGSSRSSHRSSKAASRSSSRASKDSGSRPSLTITPASKASPATKASPSFVPQTTQGASKPDTPGIAVTPDIPGSNATPAPSDSGSRVTPVPTDTGGKVTSVTRGTRGPVRISPSTAPDKNKPDNQAETTKGRTEQGVRPDDRNIVERFEWLIEACQTKKVILFVLVTLMTLLFITGVLFMVMAATADDPRSTTVHNVSRNYPVCASDGCVRHSQLLDLSRETRETPCDDFSLYVCTRWKTLGNEASRSVSGQVTANWIRDLTARSGSARGTTGAQEPLDRFARQLMARCLERRTENSDQRDLRLLAEFLGSEELSFLRPPQSETRYSDVLRAVVVLTAKWLVPLWFRLDVLPNRRAGNSRVFLVTPEKLVLTWRLMYNTLVASTRYGNYLGHFLNTLYADPNLTTDAYRNFLPRSAEVQGFVFGNLSVNATESRPIPVHGRLTDLQRFVPEFSSAAWVVALRDAYANSSGLNGPAIAETDAVHVKSVGLLRSISETLRLPAVDLLHQTTWWFHQQLAVLTSNRLYREVDEIFTGLGVPYKQTMCPIQVAITYNLPLAAADYANRNGTEMGAITDVLRSVHSTTVEKLKKKSDLKRDVSDTLLALLSVTSPVIWPRVPAPVDVKEVIQRLHGNTVNDSLGFFGHWLFSRRQLQASIAREEHVIAAEVYRLQPATPSYYTLPLEVISVGIPALTPPFYYRDGTAAMLYGGLGFHYAQSLFSAMNEAVHTMPATDRLTDVFACPQELYAQSIFPSLPALEVAYAAYIRHLNGRQDPRLQGSEQFSAEQIFFITACHTLCAQTETHGKWCPACSGAVRNFEPFARAFNCSENEPMNEMRKCVFFAT